MFPRSAPPPPSVLPGGRQTSPPRQTGPPGYLPRSPSPRRAENASTSLSPSAALHLSTNGASQPDTIPFSHATDFWVEGLFQLEGSNYALYHVLQVDAASNALRKGQIAPSELLKQLRASVLLQLGLRRYRALQEDVWLHLCPGELSSLTIGAIRARHMTRSAPCPTELTPVLASVEWPLRFRVALRCHQADGDRAIKALCDLPHGGESWWLPLLKPFCSSPSSLRMIPPDSPDTTCGPAARGTRRPSSPLVVEVPPLFRSPWRGHARQDAPLATRELRVVEVETSDMTEEDYRLLTEQQSMTAPPPQLSLDRSPLRGIPDEEPTPRREPPSPLPRHS
jgi:hypothetical protein